MNIKKFLREHKREIIVSAVTITGAIVGYSVGKKRYKPKFISHEDSFRRSISVIEDKYPKSQMRFHVKPTSPFPYALEMLYENDNDSIYVGEIAWKTLGELEHFTDDLNKAVREYKEDIK